MRGNSPWASKHRAQFVLEDGFVLVETAPLLCARKARFRLVGQRCVVLVRGDLDVQCLARILLSHVL